MNHAVLQLGSGSASRARCDGRAIDRQLCHREIIVLTSPAGGFMLSLAS
jgi:hypothetical protein